MVAGVEVLRGELKMPLRRVQLALNSFLPVDIRIVEVRRVLRTSTLGSMRAASSIVISSGTTRR